MPYKNPATQAEYLRIYHKRKKHKGVKLSVAEARQKAGKPPLSKREKMSETERKAHKAESNKKYYLKRKELVTK